MRIHLRVYHMNCIRDFNKPNVPQKLLLIKRSTTPTGPFRVLVTRVTLDGIGKQQR